MIRHYRLEGHEPVPCLDVLDWAAWFETAERRVMVTHLDRLCVSTVFVGLDHRYFGKGPPLVFETMVFVGADGLWQVRTSTWDQAEAAHKVLATQAVALARAVGLGRGGRTKRTASRVLLAMHLDANDDYYQGLSR